MAQFNTEELLSKYAEVSSRIKANIIKHEANFHLTLDDIAITHLTFGREFMKAVESKQVSSQETERTCYCVQRVEQEWIASVTWAKGATEAVMIITTAMERAGNVIVEVLRIDAAKEIRRRLILNIINPVRLIVCVLCVSC